MLLAASALLALSSCYRDEIFEPVEYEEGLATRISLRIGVPERSIATRADMPDGTDSEVNSLWVGIFSANEPYQCTFAHLYEGINVPDTASIVRFAKPPCSDCNSAGTLFPSYNCANVH